MQHKNLLDVFTRQALTRDGDTWNVPAGVSATVYLSFDEESLIIDRVTKLEVTAELGYVVTARKERYAFELETLRALRFVSEK
jgi:hypothetical protein